MSLHVYVDSPFVWISFKDVGAIRDRIVFMSDMKPDVNFPGIPVHLGVADEYTRNKGKAHRNIYTLSRYSTVKEFTETLQDYVKNFGTLDIDNDTEYLCSIFMGTENCPIDNSWLKRRHKILAVRFKPSASIGSAEVSRGTLMWDKHGEPTINAEPFKRRNYIADFCELMGSARLLPLC